MCRAVFFAALVLHKRHISRTGQCHLPPRSRGPYNAERCTSCNSEFDGNPSRTTLHNLLWSPLPQHAGRGTRSDGRHLTRKAHAVLLPLPCTAASAGTWAGQKASQCRTVSIKGFRISQLFSELLVQSSSELVKQSAMSVRSSTCSQFVSRLFRDDGVLSPRWHGPSRKCSKRQL